jgi:quercetin dioxygenase-like cupin family protein
MNEQVERIVSQDRLLALVLRAGYEPAETTFLTDDDETFQLGFFVYPKNGVAPPHTHPEVERHLTRTAELLLVRKGRCVLTLYTEDGEPVTERQLDAGDAVYLAAGGHGLRTEEDTVVLALKQGPYGGPDEKRRF